VGAEEVKSYQPNPNELTAVLNKNLFDERPGDLTGQLDLERWDRFRKAYHRASNLEIEPFPPQVNVELSSACQLKCSFCLHSEIAIPKRSLGHERFQRIIAEGKEHGLCSVKLSNINEPLMEPDFPDYVEHAKNNGVLNVYFATNGLLLKGRLARRLINAKVSKIMVSLDAITNETFNIMRNSDRLDEITANIRAFVDLRNRMGLSWPLVRVNFLQTERNIHEGEEFVKYWKDIADMIGFQQQVAVPGRNETVLQLESVDMFRCAFPFKMVDIDSSGEILPCCTFNGRSMPLGHIDEITIEDAWNSPAMKALKELHQAGRYRDNPVCRHCVLGSENTDEATIPDLHSV